MEKLKKRIAERKSAYATKKTSDVITLKPQKTVEDPREHHVEFKKEEEIITGQETNTDSNISIIKIKKQDRKKAKPSHEFKVLGVNDFEKKAKVFFTLST